MSRSTSSNGKPSQSIFNSCVNHLTHINHLTNINQLRHFQAIYDPRQAPETLKLQLLIKSHKSLVSSSENSSRDSHSVSKQLYLWSCEQTDRAIQDVGDRLAYMTYQMGDIQLQFSQTLEKSRADLKQLRNMENELIKLRDREKNLQAHIDKTQQDARFKKAESTERVHAMLKEHQGIQERMGEITNQIPIQKRRLLKSSYQTQFQAYQELADKLSIISSSGQRLLDELDEDPSIEYRGEDRTAHIKAQVANSLAHLKGVSTASVPTGVAWAGNFEPQADSFELNRADTRMFGETHPHVLTNSMDEVNTIDSAIVGSTLSAEANQSSGNSKVNDRKEPILSIKVASEGPSKRTSGSSQPPKLPDRPKVEPQCKSNKLNHNFPHGDGKKNSEESPDHNDDSPNTTDLPPAYTPSQSENS